MLLVTGATGYLGQALVALLVAEGAPVRALVRTPAKAEALPAAVERAAGDLADEDALARALSGCEGVMHLAAGLGSSFDAARENNVAGTRRLLRAAARAGVRRIVHTSSSAAIIDPAGLVSERAANQTALVDPYSVTKAEAEGVIFDAVREGFDARIVNPVNIFGPSPAGALSYNLLFLAFLRGQLAQAVDAPVGWVTAADTARAHLLAYERGEAGRRYVACGEVAPFSAVLNTVAELWGSPRRLVALPPGSELGPEAHPFARRSEVYGKLPPVTIDDAQARALGFTPQPLAAALPETVRWLRAFGNGGGAGAGEGEQVGGQAQVSLPSAQSPLARRAGAGNQGGEGPPAPAGPFPPIAVANVSRWFGAVVAVSDVSFTVQPGITGLLGPNGAGKTTLLRMLAGLLGPSRGNVRVLGQPVRGNPEIYRHITLIMDKEAVYPFLTAREFVTMNAHLQGIRDPAPVEQALATVELADAADRKLGGYSKGMRQRARLAAGLVHNPQVLLLDEPFSGADPRQRVHLMGLVRRLAAEGKTILFSSHILEEVEQLAGEVLVITHGKLAAAGDVGGIRRAMLDRPHRVRIRASDVRALAAGLVFDPAVTGVEMQPEEGRIVVEARELLACAHAIPRVAKATAVRLFEVAPEDESLERVFAYLVGQAG